MDSRWARYNVRSSPYPWLYPAGAQRNKDVRSKGQGVSAKSVSTMFSTTSTQSDKKHVKSVLMQSLSARPLTLSDSLPVKGVLPSATASASGAQRCDACNPHMLYTASLVSHLASCAKRHQRRRILGPVQQALIACKVRRHREHAQTISRMS